MPSVVIDFAAFKAVRAIVSSAVVFWEKNGDSHFWGKTAVEEIMFAVDCCCLFPARNTCK